MKQVNTKTFKNSKTIEKSSITHVFYLSVDTEFTDTGFVSLQLAFYKQGELVKKCFVCNFVIMSLFLMQNV